MNVEVEVEVFGCLIFVDGELADEEVIDDRPFEVAEVDRLVVVRKLEEEEVVYMQVEEQDRQEQEPS